MTDVPDHKAMTAIYNEKVADIRPILHDLEMEIEGAVLAELTAIYLAKQPEFLRDTLLRMQIIQIIRMIPLTEFDLIRAGMKDRIDE